jgi:ABC-type branched-subunit amino acid transport system substrate-binding protein
MFKIFKILIVTILFFISSYSTGYSNSEKIKIGLLIPLTGEHKKLGQIIIKSVKMALNDIGTDKIEIYPKDTNANPNKALQSAVELKNSGVKIIIGPVFFKSLIYLDDVSDIIFLSFTNKTLDLPQNVISTGINSLSQINTIKKFIKLNEIKKTIFLTPDLDYQNEIKETIKESKIKISKHYTYNTEPTKLTKQIEKITNYKRRKQNLLDEINRVEKSDLPDKEKQLEKLKKKYTIGRVKFDSVIISDFEESLKSVITSLLYADVSPKKKYFIAFNQWFDESLLNERSTQPLYYPSINKKNLDDFKRKFNNKYDEEPNHIALLSYDLIGLVYYLSLKHNEANLNDSFKKKNTFKGKIGIFEIQNNKIHHELNFYKIDDGVIKKIF